MPVHRPTESRLYRNRKQDVSPKDPPWSLDTDQLTSNWRDHPLHLPVATLPEEVESCFLKLQGLGLARSVEYKDFETNRDRRVFALLPKGCDFVRYIQEMATDRKCHVNRSWPLHQQREPLPIKYSSSQPLENSNASIRTIHRH